MSEHPAAEDTAPTWRGRTQIYTVTLKNSKIIFSLNQPHLADSVKESPCPLGCVEIGENSKF